MYYIVLFVMFLFAVLTLTFSFWHLDSWSNFTSWHLSLVMFWWRTVLVWNVNLNKYIEFKTSKSLARIIFSQNELNLIDEEGVSGCVTKTKTVCLQTWGRPDIWLCYRQIDRLFILIVSRLGDCHNLLFGTACLKDMRINVYKWLLKTMMSSSE